MLHVNKIMLNSYNYMTVTIAIVLIIFAICVFVFKTLNDRFTQMEKNLRDIRYDIREIEQLTRQLDRIDNALDNAIAELRRAENVLRLENEMATELEIQKEILNDPLDFFELRDDETTMVK